MLFGTATASYQIEGSIDVDGKVENIWDRFTKIKGTIADGTDGSIVCDSYLKYKDDVKILKELGVKAYRFSISWSRVIDASNKPNLKGIMYYQNLCKELKKAGIIPYITLYHWDMPCWLEDKGGFLNEDISDYFAYYTDIITKALDGLARDYITINEPQCIMMMGHRECLHAPGTKYTDKEMLQAIHNLLLCHGKAVSVIRRNVKSSTVGFAPCSRPMIPVDDNDPELFDKCYDKYFELTNDYEFPNSVSIYSDPVFLGDYPKDYYEVFKDILPDIKKEDMKLIGQKVDYIYQNFYTGTYFKLNDGKLEMVPFDKDYPTANIEWLQIVPKTLYYGPKYLYMRYNLPIIISENGCCDVDNLVSNKVHDKGRIDYIRKYLSELNKVKKEVPILGYFYWSLFDNFEWNAGLSKRFGLVYVDYNNKGKRIKKDSFYEFKKIIKQGV